MGHGADSDDTDSNQLARARRFFEAFDAAFVSFDGHHIALRYAEPYLACRADGSSETFPLRRETGVYFQRVVDGYHASGVRSCRHRDLVVIDVGSSHLLATVTWDLLDRGLEVTVTWRESYLLVDDGVSLQVRSSIDHRP